LIFYLYGQLFLARFCRITLPDGQVKEGKRWITSPMDIAKGISKGLAASALISEVGVDVL